MNPVIVQCGTQSPLGTWTSMTAANVRSGIARIRMHPDYEDKEWQRIKVSMADYLKSDLPNLLRFQKLAAMALIETLSPFKRIKPRTGQIPLLIGLPQPREGLSAQLPQKLIKSIQSKLISYPLSIQPEFFRADHSSGLIALKQAMERLEQGKVEFCIVGGVESYFHPETLKWLEATENLKCASNKSGMIPGEAAGFCLLTTAETARHYGLKSLATVAAVADTLEDTVLAPGAVCLGKGLSNALTAVLASLPKGRQVQQIYCDFNGQRQRVDEYGYAVLKLSRYFENANAIVAPANLWGDLGAASAPLLISLVTEAARKGYAKSDYQLVFTSSLGAHRAALLLNLNLSHTLQS